MNNSQEEKKCCEKCWKNLPQGKDCKTCGGETTFSAKCIDLTCPCHTFVARDRIVQDKLKEKMNARGEKIAKRHGRKFAKFTFGYLMR